MTFRPQGRRLSGALLAVFLAATAFAAAPPAVQASAASDAESLIIALVNQDRVAAGLTPLRGHWQLESIAGIRAGRMASANTVSHSVGGDIGAQLDGRDVTWYRYGETIGASTRSWAEGAARHLYSLWMASDAHRALLMSTRFNYIGVGLALRSSNGKTFGSVLMTESLDVNGARSWLATPARSGDDIRWAWGGADLMLQTHMAGLRDYDVQLRVDGGTWKTYANDTTTTFLTLRDRPSGHSYGLRARATDKRGNIGAWTAEARVTLP